jgi:uridine phosphorylase
MTEKKLPLTGLSVGSVSKGVVVCGDPSRAAKIAQSLSRPKLLSKRREYHTYQGSFKGTMLTVCSHGIGAPGAAIAFEELIAAGAQQIIRVGTCGGLQPKINAGHLIIATAAVQNSGYGQEMVPPGYPAVADPKLTMALEKEASKEQQRHTMGLVLTRDVFYGGVDTPSTPHYQIMSEANVQAVEMECAALFIVGSLRSIQTAAILAVDGNVAASRETMDSYQPHQDVVTSAVEAAIEITLSVLHNENGLG